MGRKPVFALAGMTGMLIGLAVTGCRTDQPNISGQWPKTKPSTPAQVQSLPQNPSGTNFNGAGGTMPGGMPAAGQNPYANPPAGAAGNGAFNNSGMGITGQQTNTQFTTPYGQTGGQTAGGMNMQPGRAPMGGQSSLGAGSNFGNQGFQSPAITPPGNPNAMMPAGNGLPSSQGSNLSGPEMPALPPPPHQTQYSPSMPALPPALPGQ